MTATAHPDLTDADASLLQGARSALAAAFRICGRAWSGLVLAWLTLRIVALFAKLIICAVARILAAPFFVSLLGQMPQAMALDILLSRAELGPPMARAPQLLRLLRHLPALRPPP